MDYPGAKIVPVLVVLAVAAVGVLGPDDARSVAQAAPGPSQVLVVNPASGPVQSAIVGSVTATVANTTAIPVAVEGTANVALSGPVTVGNTAAEAIPVRDVGAAPVAWVGGGEILIPPGEEHASRQFLSVPPGKRFVLESLGIRVALPTGQIANEATVLASAAGIGAIFRFPMVPLPPPSATFDAFGTYELTKLNVSGGLVVGATRNDTIGTGLVNVALSGYLVDVN